MDNNSAKNEEKKQGTIENIEAEATETAEVTEAAVDQAENTQAKKKKTAKQNKANQKSESGIVNYFRGVKLEMRKVVWPTRSELSSYTAIVLCTCAAFALLFWGIDSGVLAAIKAICF